MDLLRSLQMDDLLHLQFERIGQHGGRMFHDPERNIQHGGEISARQRIVAQMRDSQRAQPGFRKPKPPRRRANGRNSNPKTFNPKQRRGIRPDAGNRGGPDKADEQTQQACDSCEGGDVYRERQSHAT